MAKQNIRKAIIPAAGLGTRFLPATKAQPKEMLPIIDKPAIQYIVEEAIASGIEDILIVTGRNKRAIEDHFDRSVELELFLSEKQKWNTLREVQNISNLVDIHFIRQKEPRGLGHAIHCARTFVDNEKEKAIGKMMPVAFSLFANLLPYPCIISETMYILNYIFIFESLQISINRQSYEVNMQKRNKLHMNVLTMFATGIILAGVVIAVWTYQAAHAAKPKSAEYSVTITDSGFQPSRMNATTGVSLKIHVKNIGTKVHNFVLPSYFIFSPNLKVGESTDIEFTPDKKGIFPFYSDAPGNPEPGLKGQLSVN